REKGWSTKWADGGPTVLWKTSVGTGYSSVSVSKNRVYTVGNIDKTDIVYCLDVNNGSVIWKYSYPCVADGAGYPGPASTPIIDGNSVYILSREGHLFCLNADTGKVIWSKHIVDDFGAQYPDWGFSCSPQVFGDKLILAVSLNLALNKKTGDLIWKTQNYHGGYSSPFVFQYNNKSLIAVFNTVGLMIFNLDDGKEVARAEWKTDYNVNAVTPIVSDSNIFISSNYNAGGALYKFDGKSLTQIWKNKNMRNHFNSCVLWQGCLYGFDMEQLRCIDFKTGAVKWTQKGLGMGSVMIADGKLIALGDNGILAIAEAVPDGYKELARAKVLDGLCWTVPVLSNGKIYCRNHEGDLVCLDVKAK
ncbi:TPA: alcohol dehydrogenase, partial [Candidatus Poribacteria bacterium]|nr:alcohol dehydrogenase [Candidatus Poribacteria bacterium]